MTSKYRKYSDSQLMRLGAVKELCRRGYVVIPKGVVQNMTKFKTEFEPKRRNPFALPPDVHVLGVEDKCAKH